MTQAPGPRPPDNAPPGATTPCADRLAQEPSAPPRPGPRARSGPAEQVSGGLILRSPEGTAYRFDPGTLCLEFLTTGGPGPPARYNALRAPSDLAVFAELSRLRLDRQRVRVTPAELAEALRLREELWRLARGRTRSRPLEHLGVLNSAAAGPPLVPRAENGRRTWAAPATGAQIISQIARDAIELLTGPLRDRVRECAADDCYLIFVDTSRPGGRRWCSMEHCGNRHKVKAHRARTGIDTRHPAPRRGPAH